MGFTPLCLPPPSPVPKPGLEYFLIETQANWFSLKIIIYIYHLYSSLPWILVAWKPNQTYSFRIFPMLTGATPATLFPNICDTFFLIYEKKKLKRNQSNNHDKPSYWPKYITWFISANNWVWYWVFIDGPRKTVSMETVIDNWI